MQDQTDSQPLFEAEFLSPGAWCYIVGGLVIFIGLVVIVIAINLKVTVAAGDHAVVNLGLLQRQLLAFTGGVGATLGGLTICSTGAMLNALRRRADYA